MVWFFSPRVERGGPNVLILAPTRELAQQIQTEINKISYKRIRRYVIWWCVMDPKVCDLVVCGGRYSSDEVLASRVTPLIVRVLGVVLQWSEQRLDVWFVWDLSLNKLYIINACLCPTQCQGLNLTSTRSHLVTETNDGQLKTHNKAARLETNFVLKSIINKWIIFGQVKIDPGKWKCCHHLPGWQLKRHCNTPQLVY